MKDRMTYQERDLMMNAVLAYAEKQNENNKVLAYAYAWGMVRSTLTDQQVRDLFRMTHE